MRKLIKLLRRQDGIAMPTVLGVITTTSLLATGAMTVASQSSRDSARDRDGKAAAAAAQAAGEYAFKMTADVQPAADRCVTNAAVPPLAGGECPSYTVPAASGLGNGAIMRYTVSRPGPLYCPGATSDTDRCIVGVGQVNGVVRRVRRIAMVNPIHTPWNAVGVKAKNLVEIMNSGNWTTNVGTNGQWIAGNSANITGQIQLGPDGTGFWGNSSYATEGTASVPAWTFPDVDFAPSVTTNNNALLSSSVYTNNAGSPRRLYMGDSVNLDFPAVAGGLATYNFCSFEMTNSNTIRIPAGQTVRIYIDSPARAGSGCTGTGTGRMLVTNSAVLNEKLTNGNDGKNPAQLEFYVYGTATGGDEDTPDIDFNNSTKFWGTIYAPNSYMYFNNSAELGGGIVGRDIVFKNSSGFNWDTRIRDRGLPGQEASERKTWTECLPNPSNAADPESGCS